MSDDFPPAFDLFGEVWIAPKDRRGRPPHKRSKEVAESVALLVATGAKEQEIETATGLSAKTLRKYYSREMTNAPNLIRAVLNMSMLRKALSGNPAAAKFIRDELAKGDNDQFAKQQARTEREPRSQPKGKKEAAAEAALTAGQETGWGDDLSFGVKPN